MSVDIALACGQPVGELERGIAQRVGQQHAQIAAAADAPDQFADATTLSEAYSEKAANERNRHGCKSAACEHVDDSLGGPVGHA